VIPVKKLYSAFILLAFACSIAQARPHYRGYKHKTPAETTTAANPATSAETGQDPNVPKTPLEFSLTKEKEQLTRELAELRKTSAGAVEIKKERDDLQAWRVNAERDLAQLKLENQALKDSANQDWFLYGGCLALAGVVLGFIIPKISWGRRNSWGSF
jgi:SH3 domain protein